jgi:hypothetical protein
MKASTWFKVISSAVGFVGGMAAVFYAKKVIDRKMAESKKTIIEANDPVVCDEEIVTTTDEVTTVKETLDGLERAIRNLNKRGKTSRVEKEGEILVEGKIPDINESAE